MEEISIVKNTNKYMLNYGTDQMRDMTNRIGDVTCLRIHNEPKLNN